MFFNRKKDLAYGPKFLSLFILKVSLFYVKQLTRGYEINEPFSTQKLNVNCILTKLTLKFPIFCEQNENPVCGVNKNACKLKSVSVYFNHFKIKSNV